MSQGSISRRDLLRRGASATLTGALVTGLPVRALGADVTAGSAQGSAAFGALEHRHDARLGVWAINHRTGDTIGWRADERFSFGSTYKGLLVARVLRDVAPSVAQLNRVVQFSAHELTEGSPVTGAFQSLGLTVGSLCAAAIAYSDNTAANLLFGLSGGPHGLQRFLRGLGDDVSRSDRTEPTVNDFGPGDTRDTTSPHAFGRDYSQLLLGTALPAAQRAQLRSWMQGDAVNVERFRAGLPAGWVIADKTGTGFTRIANDVGVVWTPGGTALTIAVFTMKNAPKAAPDDALVAAAARLVARTLAADEL